MTLLTPTDLTDSPWDRGRAAFREGARNEPLDRRLFRWFGNATGALVLLYLFFDRGAAHLHIPHVPGYLAEYLLAFGVIVVAVGTKWVGRASRFDTLMGVLIGFMAYCVLRTVPNFRHFPIITTFHDAALWYYGVFALMLVAAFMCAPDLFGRWVKAFSRAVPWLSLWLPVALFLDRSSHRLLLRFKYSNVPLLTHKPGNICVVTAICLAWTWLVPNDRRSPAARGLLTAVNLFTMLVGATQTRGGGLADLVSLVLVLVMMGRRRGPLIAGAVAGLLAIVVVGGVTGVTFHTTHRNISVSQLLENGASLEAPGTANPGLSGSVNFRETLWKDILVRQVDTSHLFDGFGFGPDLARIGGVEPKPRQTQQQALRSAHNSLLDILARTGLIGAFLWLLLWLGWYRRLVRGRRSRRAERDETGRGILAVCIVAATAIFVNCFFDPTLEGPQVDVVLFAVFAVGLYCARTPFAATPRANPLTRRGPRPAGRER